MFEDFNGKEPQKHEGKMQILQNGVPTWIDADLFSPVIDHNDVIPLAEQIAELKKDIKDIVAIIQHIQWARLETCTKMDLEYIKELNKRYMRLQTKYED